MYIIYVVIGINKYYILIRCYNNRQEYHIHYRIILQKLGNIFQNKISYSPFPILSQTEQPPLC